MRIKMEEALSEQFEHNFDSMNLNNLKNAVIVIRELATIEAMDNAIHDEVGDNEMSAYMGERNMQNLIAYINHLSDDVNTMLSASPMEHKNYVKNAMANIVKM